MALPMNDNKGIQDIMDIVRPRDKDYQKTEPVNTITPKPTEKAKSNVRDISKIASKQVKGSKPKY